ncbi:histidine phosphatase family protein [Rhodoplanes sp. TEM]|uniref:phosphoglycerate mutase (2,3-diphosphoglycerate-dependent) n=1 Tax=Rhodoplanes tepidamans TaxID=200616 RepID=A0ABT5J700_RHOTP|nr:MULTISPECIES: histidine phosphatase family protein [Rhodoplanes]MDC7785227.1 histidine phosphatase family protein [Rhodoplanes tepidamans]MDC7986421.1 histidine phosphatase family protein [Rhodoplanes sp. TEM]MDQ0353485.1 putative phosphoglycerate mutase [Rhodoplanes tepidamans]
MTRSVLLVRHGEVEGDGAERFVGRTDLPMSAAGEARIVTLAAGLAGRPLDAIWCSGLARSRRTAALLAAGRGIPVRVASALAEIDMGDWEGLSRRAVAAQQPGAYAARGRDLAGFRPPGGESFADLAARVLPCWRTILAGPEDAVAIAGHAGVNRVILCDVLGLPLANLFRLAQTPGGVTLIEIGRQGPVVRLLDALSAPAAALAPAQPAVPSAKPSAMSAGAVPETLRC